MKRSTEALPVIVFALAVLCLVLYLSPTGSVQRMIESVPGVGLPTARVTELKLPTSVRITQPTPSPTQAYRSDPEPSPTVLVTRPLESTDLVAMPGVIGSSCDDPSPPLVCVSAQFNVDENPFVKAQVNP
jgi:hypothetical protein